MRTVSRRTGGAARRVVLLAAAMLAGAAIGPPAATSAITPVANDAAGAEALAAAMLADPSALVSASFLEVPSAGAPNGTADAPFSFFPKDGATFGILTSGAASIADDPNTSGSSTTALGSGPIRGGFANDATILALTLEAPAAANCLSLDFAFYSEEFPEWVDTSFNDAFIAELDSSTWTTTEEDIIAPDNFAFDVNGDVVSINSTGATSMSLANAAGTTYDGATVLLRASTPTVPGVQHTLYLSIFDNGDRAYDSAALVDNIRTRNVRDPAVNCKSGAAPANRPPVAEAAGPYEVDEGASTGLDGSGSSDPENDVLDYAWDLDGDGSFETPGVLPAFSAATLDSGDNTVALRVCDGSDDCDVDTAVVTVRNVAPVVDAGPDQTVARGQPLTLTGSWTDPAGPLDDDYTWAWDVVPDDVSARDARLATASYGTVLTHTATFAAVGVVTLRLSVTDDDGATGSDEVRVTVVDPLVVPDPPALAAVTLPGVADLAVTKRVDRAAVTGRAPMTWTITVANRGPGTAAGVVVGDVPSLPVALRSVTTSQGTCRAARCELGTMAAGQVVTIRVVGRARVAGVLHNDATVFSATPDPEPSNGGARATTRVRGTLRLSKTANKRSVHAGRLVAYRLKVSNPGGVAVPGATVCDRLPGGLAYVSSTPAARLRAGRWCWQVGTVAAGSSRTVRLVARVLRGTRGGRTNTATLTAPGIAAGTAAGARVAVLGVGVRGGGVTG